MFTTLALLAFAANSVLCRLALSDQHGDTAIDAASFTLIRLSAGALVLLLILALRKAPTQASDSSGTTSSGTTSSKQRYGSWSAALLLFGYAIAFSYAYNSLDTATGALILFGSVQLTIILFTLWRGTHLQRHDWLGLGLALSGLVYLLLPGLNTPSMGGFILMAVAGIAWGGYTLKGKGSTQPLADTAHNFKRTLPLAAILLPLVVLQGSVSVTGIGLAIASGAIASGIGYSIWYHALAGLSATQAGVVQLMVPVIAAGGGVLFVGEILSWRLVIAALLILGGIALTLVRRR